MKEPRPGYKFFNADCMDIMKYIPDKYFDLAVVDPPYGIGAGKRKGRQSKGQNIDQFKIEKYKVSDWDNLPPDKHYFKELNRISKNQIIWGGNHFILPISRGWIFWDKMPIVPNYSDGELAWTSFDKVLKRKVIHWNGKIRTGIEKDYKCIHPTQKPKALYKWIYDNYAKEGQRVIDTHLGSNSNGIAAYYSKKIVEFWGIEKDQDYFRDGVNRFIKETSDMFNPAEIELIK